MWVLMRPTGAYNAGGERRSLLQPSFEPAPRPPPNAAGYAAFASTQPRLEEGKEKADSVVTIDRLHFKRVVVLLHILVLLILFVPLVMLGCLIGGNQDVQYFVGTGFTTLAYATVPAIIIMVPMLHGCMKKIHPWLFLMTLWLPAFLFTMLSFYYKDQLHLVKGALENRDCTTFTEKRHLVLAYREAGEIYETCSATRAVSSIRDCPHYFDMFLDHAREFEYLQELEQRFSCTGICKSGRRLWEKAGVSAPGCDSFVSQWIIGAGIQANLMFVYSLFLILVGSPLMAVFLEVFMKGYYIPICNAA